MPLSRRRAAININFITVAGSSTVAAKQFHCVRPNEIVLAVVGRRSSVLPKGRRVAIVLKVRGRAIIRRNFKRELKSAAIDSASARPFHNDRVSRVSPLSRQTAVAAPFE